MNPREVMDQNDGETTKAFYALLSKHGPIGELAVAIFRSQKRSGRAKEYRRGKWRRAAYDVKAWSMSEIDRILSTRGAELGIAHGWKQDPATVFGEDASWVLYVSLPNGQVSFHSPTRGPGPDYAGDWDGQHASRERVISFCEQVLAGELRGVQSSASGSP
jgi:hypothetical protein